MKLGKSYGLGKYSFCDIHQNEKYDEKMVEHLIH